MISAKCGKSFWDAVGKTIGCGPSLRALLGGTRLSYGRRPKVTFAAALQSADVDALRWGTTGGKAELELGFGPVIGMLAS